MVSHFLHKEAIPTAALVSARRHTSNVYKPLGSTPRSATSSSQSRVLTRIAHRRASAYQAEGWDVKLPAFNISTLNSAALHFLFSSALVKYSLEQGVIAWQFLPLRGL